MPSERATIERQNSDIEELKRGMNDLKDRFVEYGDLSQSIQEDIRSDSAETKTHIERIENDLHDKDECMEDLKSSLSETKTDIKLIAKDIGWLRDNYKETKEIMEKGRDIIAACSACKDPKLLQELKDRTQKAQIISAVALTLILAVIAKLTLF